ncbi:hypothetical protein EDD11_002991 [Mortierella claussenii]|nr:hypothetical protein EDD11_002991 [Mortierella claussenii]
MSTPLPLEKRKKADLKELAASLDLSDKGVREDIIERIKFHVINSNDTSLQALIRESSPTFPSRLSPKVTPTTTSAGGPQHPVDWKVTETIQSFHAMIHSNDSGDHRHSRDSSTDSRHSKSNTEIEEIPEHEAHQFVEHLQDEFYSASSFANELEETLRDGERLLNSRDLMATGTREDEGEEEEEDKSDENEEGERTASTRKRKSVHRQSPKHRHRRQKEHYKHSFAYSELAAATTQTLAFAVLQELGLGLAHDVA